MIARQRKLIAEYLRDQSVGIMLPELRGVVSHLPVEDIRQQLGDDAMRAWTDEAICNAVIYGRIEPAVKLENKLPPAWQFIKTRAAEQQQRFYSLIDVAADRYFKAKQLSQGGAGARVRPAAAAAAAAAASEGGDQAMSAARAAKRAEYQLSKRLKVAATDALENVSCGHVTCIRSILLYKTFALLDMLAMLWQIRADADTRHKQLLDAIGGDNPIASSNPLHALDASAVQTFLKRENCPLTARMCAYAKGDGYFLAEAIDGMGWRQHDGHYLLADFCGAGADGKLEMLLLLTAVRRMRCAAAVRRTSTVEI